ncbi:MAG TPA: CoA-binding protein [Prolixibacteraceae bacterium]|nr:CoA-binding protein [Prolixibacteraceae bacterium]
MNTLAEIKSFLEPKKLAVAGASRNPKKFGGIVLAELKKKGFELYPVNPAAGEISGLKCYASVSDLPDGVDKLLIVTPGTQTAAVVEQAIRRGVGSIWIQQKSETPEALDLARQHRMKVISGRCILMFAEPVESIHGFHRWLSKVFGSYPK